MKPAIHPEYHQATFTCECGNTFTVGSTVKTFSTELCSKCHPFYTGQQKIVDTARRVEKFMARSAQKSTSIVSKRVKKDAVKAKKQPKAKKEDQ